ncbi:hypothetical protein LTR78_009827 [Recurvomyces mirabilis]|uniref:Malic acid transport protein n=1 Tax=Recurvomyces mirabilis TaxID=574656 RepID=A0AAE0TN53_9PEZI|nr:hypothetical protein LTR78_009827 [Recurvomyces mirabilis]KAK5153063.1 hypothetical protein LTS14_007707 [Recurvomyces mirabilis]
MDSTTATTAQPSTPDEEKSLYADLPVAAAETHHDAQHHPPTLKQRISHFTWPWFACTMSTGALSAVLASTPNRFPGLDTIGKIFYILDLCLFVLFTCLMATRFWFFPRKFTKSMHHAVEGLFFGAYFVSVALVIGNAQSYGVPACGPWLVTTLKVCFWIYCGVVFCVGVMQYYLFFQLERMAVADAMPAWIFPIYPLLVVGNTAGTLIPSQPQSAAYPMWLGAVMLQGLSWTVSLMMYAIYTQRLMTSALPSPPTRPGMYVSVGPAGYTAAALISLGINAPSVIPPDAWDFSSLPDGSVVKVLGVVSGIFLILFSAWFFFVSTISILAGVRQMSFSLNWWAFIFPNAGLTLALIQAGKALDSSGINAICTALTILLVVMWLVTAVAHLRALRKGDILWPGKDEDKDMEDE